MNYIEILDSKKKFPCKINKKEGKILTENFERDKTFHDDHNDKKDIEFRYFKKNHNAEYVLIEEYMFRDNETYFELNRAIDINYYLSKK